MYSIEAAYAAFCETRFGLPTELQVVAREERIGVSFPEDYRQFVLQYNGGYFSEPRIEAHTEGCPLDRLTFMRGINAPEPFAELCSEAALALFTENDPAQIVVIGDTMMGNLIILTTAEEGRGTILLKTFYDWFEIAEGIEDFFSLLKVPPPD